MITLTKSVFSGDRTITLTPNWVSDGHFAVRRNALANQAAWTNPEVVQSVFGVAANNVRVLSENPDIFTPPQETVSVKTSPWLYEVEGRKGKLIVRLLLREDSGLVFVDDKILKLVDVRHETWVQQVGDPQSALYTSSGQVIVMPFVLSALNKFWEQPEAAPDGGTVHSEKEGI